MSSGVGNSGSVARARAVPRAQIDDTAVRAEREAWFALRMQQFEALIGGETPEWLK
jgi:hypothetical protein